MILDAWEVSTLAAAAGRAEAAGGRGGGRRGGQSGLLKYRTLKPSEAWRLAAGAAL